MVGFLMWDHILPLIGIVFGLSVCLCGGRFSRLYCFVLGFSVGTSAVYWLFESQAEIRHGGVPLIVGLLVSLFMGVLCLLLHMFTMTGILGFTIGSLLIVLDNGLVLVYYRTWIYLFTLIGAAIYTFSQPSRSLLITTASSGALLLTLGIDSYATHSFGALIFQSTFLDYSLEVESAVARCFNWRCWILIPFWIICSVCGFATQFYYQHLQEYRRTWPMIFLQQKRSNFGSSARSTRNPVTESLIAEDRNYSITNYSSYDSFQKIQSTQQQVQQAAAATAQAAQQQSSQTQAAPELGSEHANDPISVPPATRANFNFLELKRLPPQFQYLYLVIQNSFQGLVRTYGFQIDNMQNQYEHLIFLLSNYQNKPSILAQNIGLNVGGSSPGSSTPILSNSDYISQLHNKVFTNYREWISYMNLGGNSAVGGSAITVNDVPFIKSQIADSRVDKNTTDAKIEEICLWLLIWGEGGSLRHAPECLVYLFHNLCRENRKYQSLFGSAFLDAPPDSSNNFRPKRELGSFLSLVVQPIYEVMAKENSKPDGVRRNYDDINEFFWRKSCLNYYYADLKYRVVGEDEQAGGSDSRDASHPRASISIATALASGSKSFLEKRSWLHPIRSFMRLISFYGTCFHLLVCIAYIHYAHLPLLGDASNKILSSVVISVAGWSVMKEVLEIWATYGIISESIWNTIGFLMRFSIKTVMCGYLILFYTWSMENPNPILQAQYYQAYIILSCLYLLPLAGTILTQLFPTLGHQLQNANLPFVDELGKFWYPIHKIYVGRDIHEPEKDIYKYQVFWVLLLMWKMYMSLIFQISPLIQPTVDILQHIQTLSISTHTWLRWANYVEIVLLWLPFILVYLFDTIIWYFLWQAIMGILVGMNLHLGEVRAFQQLINCFTELPKEFDKKIIYSKHKLQPDQKSTSNRTVGSTKVSPSLQPERESLLTTGPQGNLVANTLAVPGSYQSGATAMAIGAVPSITPNLTAPLSTARARRGSGTITPSVTGVDDPFRNRAWENFAVVWNEIIEDLRVGDLLSNAERGLLRFRFDTSSTKEYYLPLFLMVGHIDAAIDRCTEAATDWQKGMKDAQADGGLDSYAKTKKEQELFGHFMANPIRRESVTELWEHIGWILLNLLGERHEESLKNILQQVQTLFITHQHVLRGSNWNNLTKVKNDLLNLVRSLRIASASFATLRLKEAEQRRRTQEEMEREDQAELEREAKQLEADEAAEEKDQQEQKQQGGGSGGAVDVTDDSSDVDSDDEDAKTSRQQAKKQATHRKSLIREQERKSTKGSLASAQDFNLNTIVKSGSSATLDMLVQLRSRPRHRSAVLVPSSSPVSSSSTKEDTGYLILHISLIRDHVIALLNSLASCLDTSYNRSLDRHSNHASTSVSTPNPDVNSIVLALKSIHLSNEGFMWDGGYAGKQIHAFLKNTKTNTVLSTMHSLLTIAAIDAEPKSLEAIRRLLFFSNSLFMNLPIAPSIRSMKSLSTLTPFHSEDIIYSYSDLEKKTEDGVSVFFYLQTIYPLEWQNFLQRCGINEDAFNSTRGGNILSSNKKWNMEARLWATMRGQTLGRTVDGMMLYEKALKLLLKLEEPETTSIASATHPYELDEAALLVQQKYQYVISCQVYGKQKRENDPKAADIEFLLHRYPSVRVAYIDVVKVPTRTPQGQTIIKEEFYSVLIKSDRSPTGAQEIKEVYRIKLPGNPVLGEGKPENQNHAIIFTRGEFLQTIDMNQSNYLEEALKMRNVLEEFNVNSGEKRIGIVGFREHIYTGGLSSIANFMALQEGCFVTQGQRVLDNPLRVRFHYGHPDVFDKLFFMSRGGVSKASRGINLSEDIFAGFNSVLRGGSIKFREYIQCGKGRDVGLQQLFKFEAKLAQGNSMQSISRDIYRIANTVDFFRLCSFFFGGVGFYITNCLTIWALYFFIYTRLILAGFRLESLDSFSGADTISYWFGMIGFLLTIPVFATIGLERGFRRGFIDVFRMIVTGGPLFFMFHMGTKSYYFEQTMLAGGAKYRPTGRGFVTRHEDFSEIYRFHASSHFYRSVEMLIALLLYILVIPPTYNYSLVTWAGWLIVVAWLFGPFWFNPLAFEWEKTLLDFENFTDWMLRKEGDGDKCWKAWWKDENSYLTGLENSTKFWLMVLQLRYVIVAVSLIYFVGANQQQVAIAGVVFVVCLILVLFVRAKTSLNHQFAIRLVKAVIFILVLAFILYLLEFYQIAYFNYFITIIGLTYLFHSVCNVILISGIRFHFLTQWFKLVDWLIAGLIFGILGLLSVTVIPGVIQTRLMFHNAFSRGVLIDKLLKTKPDDETTTTSTPAAPKPLSLSSTRRKDATLGRSSYSAVRNDSDEETSPEDSTVPTAAGGFDLDSISFIEKREGSSRKKLHPSKDELGGTTITIDESGGLRRTKKGAHVSFARKTPSMTNLDDLGEDGEDDEQITPSPVVTANTEQAPLNPRSMPSRSVGSTPIATGSSTVLPSYPIPASLKPNSMVRSVSDLISPTHSTGNLGVTGFPLPGSSSAGGSGRGSPLNAPNAPSSPALGASAPVNRRGDKLTFLPTAALQDERPIPKTVVLSTPTPPLKSNTPASAMSSAPMTGTPPLPPTASSNLTRSPLNPRKA